MTAEDTLSYDLLFNQNPLPMYVCDVDNLAMLDVNIAAVRFYGYSRSEFLRMTLLDFRPSEERSPLLEALEKFKKTGSHCGIWRHAKKDGTIVSVEVNAALVPFQGRRAAIVVVRYLMHPVQTLHSLEKPDLIRLIAQQSQAIATLEAIVVKLIKEQSDPPPSGHA
jgi:PAS domain S-box-containing protein